MSFIYISCVNFMINLANMLGMTYRDANALILLVVFPAITLACLTACFIPYRR